MRILTLVGAIAAAAALSACTYVERTPAPAPAPQAAVIVPQPAPQATIVQPAPSPTVTVRPSY